MTGLRSWARTATIGYSNGIGQAAHILGTPGCYRAGIARAQPLQRTAGIVGTRGCSAARTLQLERASAGAPRGVLPVRCEYLHTGAPHYVRQLAAASRGCCSDR